MMTDKVIYAPEVRLFTYHVSLLKTTNLNTPDQDINLRSIVAYYVQLLADYGVLQNLLFQQLKIYIFSPLLILDTLLDRIDNSHLFLWWCQVRIELWKLILETDIVDLLCTVVFRPDVADLKHAHHPFFQLIDNPGKIGIQRVNLPPKYRGFFYPQYINDSYSFLLHLFHPQKLGQDGVNFSDIAELRPPESFFAGTSSTLDDPLQTYLKHASWGTTLLLSGFIDSPPATLEKGKPLADELLQHLLGLDSRKTAPPFLACREFLGGFLYEYQDVNHRHPYGQILILLIFSEESKEKLNAVQWSLPELFCYERKICQNYLDSRQEYEKANQEIDTIEATIRTFPPNIATTIPPDLSETELQVLKQDIKNLLDLSLRYSQQMRSLATFENTIAINRQNYLDILTRMEVKSQADLTELRHQAKQMFGIFQGQINANLVYLQQGERLLDTAISTIRGLVEIDQAERDRSLERQIQTVGVGIAAGAIVASTSPLIFEEPMTLPWQTQRGETWHPFAIAVLLSMASAVLAWWAAQGLIWLCRHRR